MRTCENRFCFHRLVLPAVVVLLSAGAAAAQQRPQLSGSWTLNSAVSDTAGPGVRPAPKGRPVPGSEFPGEGGPRDMMANRRAMFDVMDQLQQQDDRMTISTSGDSVRILFADKTVLLLVADGKNYKFPFRDLPALQAKTSWKDGALVAEFKAKGAKVVETFFRGIDSPRLIVTTRIPDPIRPIDLRRVYDSAD